MKKYKYLTITVGRKQRYLTVQSSTPLDEGSDAIDAKERLEQKSVFLTETPLSKMLPEMDIDGFPLDSIIELLLYCSDRDKVSIDSFYNTLVSSFVRSRYSEDEMEAIICNQLDDPTNEEHAKEYKDMQAYRTVCKQTAKDVIEKAKNYYGSED